MSKPISYTSAVTFIPTSYSDNTFNEYGVLENGLNPHDGTNDYVYFRLQSTSHSIYYDFSVDIPSIATINSVSCQVRGYVSRSSNYPSVQLYSNTTAKGSATNITSIVETNVVSLTTGTWSSADLQNARLRIKTESGTNGSKQYFYFYGATLSVNYSVDGIEYEINTSSKTSITTIEPSLQGTLQGETGVVEIETDYVGDIVVKDNGIDITNQLVPKTKTTSRITTESYPISYTTGGSSFDSASAKYIGNCIGHSAENPSASTGNIGTFSSNSSGYVDYSFNFSSIPPNAIIENVEVRVYGHKESNTISDEYNIAKFDLYVGSILRSVRHEVFSSTVDKVITFDKPGAWTRELLQKAKLRFTVRTYGGYIGGITWVVNYVLPVDYYEYTINSISADHEIIVERKAIVLPEEDSGKTYYPIAISSINATTNPGEGVVRVESGTSQTITITPNNLQLTLALDNGVDISSQLVKHSTPASYTVKKSPGAKYGFTLNSSTKYYVCDNIGIDNSAAIARVTFKLPVKSLIAFEFINYAEETFDFGVFSKVDTALSNQYWQSTATGGDTTTDAGLEQIRLNTSYYNSPTPQTIVYEIESGEHFIDIKFSKDAGTSGGTDSLRFKIASIELFEPDYYYTYDLNNINQSHSLNFAFGNVNYYFVTPNISGDAKLYPDGQTVALPGDAYQLNIVPKNTTDKVSVTDNGTDVTGNLVREELQVEKEGNAITMVKYVYYLTNIQASHTLAVLSSPGQTLSVKSGGTWVSATKVFRRDATGWNEVSDYESLFDPGKIYIPKQG